MIKMIFSTKQHIRVFLAIVALSCVAPATAYADSPVDMFRSFVSDIVSAFSGKKPDANPSDTLIAPFAQPEDIKPQTPEDAASGPLPVNNIALDKPHRNPSDLAEWIDKVAAEVLTVNSDNYENILVLMKGGCTDLAITDYREWIEGTGILAALQKNDLQMNGIVTEKPYLLNDGVVDGVYRWLFEMPVTISFIPRGTVNLSSQTQKIETRKLIITVQVGRVKQSRTEHNVLIESWSVRENKRKS